MINITKFCTAIIIMMLSVISFFSQAATEFPEANLVNFKTGEQISMETLKGKILYVDFWASWCTPCKKSFPFMNDISKNYPSDKFQVIAINMDETRGDAEKFLKNYPANFNVYTNPNNKLAKTLQLPGLPIAYIVNADGEIVARHAGFSSSKKAKKIKQINELMEQK